MACFLSSIPLVGFVLTFTNVVGAALWAIDLEEEENIRREEERGRERAGSEGSDGGSGSAMLVGGV